MTQHFLIFLRNSTFSFLTSCFRIAESRLKHNALQHGPRLLSRFALSSFRSNAAMLRAPSSCSKRLSTSFKKKTHTLSLLKTEMLATAWMNIPQNLYIIEVTNSDFPGGSDSKAPAYNVGDPGSIPGSGRSPGEGNGNPLQYSCLDNPMDGGAWWATVHRVAESRT